MLVSWNIGKCPGIKYFHVSSDGMFAGVMVDDQECKEVSVSWNETSEGLMEWNVGKRAYI